MLDLENFMKLLEDAMPSEDGVFSIDEKIMSKKAARRRKLRAKKLAQQKAQQQAELEKEQEQNVENSEEKQEGTGTALVVYKEPEEDQDYERISEKFTKTLNKMDQLMSTHKQEIEQAMGIWKQAGEDSQCPEDAWNLMNTSINNFKTGIEQILDSLNPEELALPELQILDRYLTGVNGYIEKASQQIMAAKPNLVEADFQAPTVQQDGELVTQTGTDVATTTGTALVPATGTVVATVDTTPLEDDKKQTKTTQKDKREYKDLVTYKKFWKGWETQYKALQALCNGLKNLINAVAEGVKKILSLVSYPADWLNDKLFAFLTSPLAKDIVKTFMYANPITKMLFDGDFGKIGFADKLEKLHKWTKDKAQKGKSLGGDPSKANPKNYTKRKFPRDISKMTFKELKNNIYGSKAIVDCINVSYNHPKVEDNDKAKVLAYVEHIEKAFKEKKPDSVRSNFKNLIKILNKIGDYMNWNKPEDWQRLVKLYVNIAGGNTKKQTEKIKKKADNIKDAEEKQSNSKDISDWTEEDINNLPAGAIRALSKRLGLKQETETYTEERFTRLEKLLEEAEGDK